MQNERARIAEKLKTNGYFKFVKEFVFFDADTAIGDSKVDITTIIKNNENQLSDGRIVSEKHRQFTLDTIFFYTNYDPKLAIQEREKYFDLLDTTDINGYKFIYKDNIYIRPRVLMRSCFLNSGNIYNQNDVDRTYRNLSSLKHFVW